MRSIGPRQHAAGIDDLAQPRVQRMDRAKSAIERLTTGPAARLQGLAQPGEMNFQSAVKFAFLVEGLLVDVPRALEAEPVARARAATPTRRSCTRGRGGPRGVSVPDSSNGAEQLLRAPVVARVERQQRLAFGADALRWRDRGALGARHAPEERVDGRRVRAQRARLLARCGAPARSASPSGPTPPASSPLRSRRASATTSAVVVGRVLGNAALLVAGLDAGPQRLHQLGVVRRPPRSSSPVATRRSRARSRPSCSRRARGSTAAGTALRACP